MAKPMSEARRAQLVAQMERARAAQAEKRKTAHVCAPNPLEVAYKKLQEKLIKYAPDNVAPIPLAMHIEDGQWYVMIHVRIPRVTEYEVETCADTLADAISDAASVIGRQSMLRRIATRDAEIFGYTL